MYHTFVRSFFKNRARRDAYARAFGVVLILAGSIFSIAGPIVRASSSVSVWWPTDGTSVSGVQPFKAVVDTMPLERYRIFWSVDAGQANQMQDSFDGYPHKEAIVDVSGWTWNGNGPYRVTFAAYDSRGREIASQSIRLYVQASALQPTPTLLPSPTIVPALSPTPAPTPVMIFSPTPSAAPSPTPVFATPSPSPSSSWTIDVWWPTPNAVLTGTLPLKALVKNLDVSVYDMYWQVGSGQWNQMETSFTDYPHKEAWIDVSGWTWQGNGPYVLTFLAKQNTTELARTSVAIYTNNSALLPTPPPVLSPAPSPAPTPTVTPKVSGAILPGASLWVNPDSDAAQYARRTDITQYEQQMMQKVALGAEAKWLSASWISDMRSAVFDYVERVKSAGAVSVFVLYDLPFRDCGQYSSGGSNAQAYQKTVDQIAAGIGSNAAAVLLEPDGLALTDCLSSSQLQERYQLLKYAVQTLKTNPSTAVYLDIGNPNWLSISDAAARLAAADIAEADGFSLNISNFYTDDQNVQYGMQMSQELARQGIAGKHFVIDRSRNGNGSNGQWCNPSGRALGFLPTTTTGINLVDAFLWVKAPGGSDGACNGGPAAGIFWPEYAISLAENAHW